MSPDAEMVLVVDDEPGIVRALSAALRARDHLVVVAGTGAEALAEAAARPAGGDHPRPRPSRHRWDRGVPAAAALVRAPIIVLTAEGGESRKVEARDEGADDYVTKPFSTPELLARVSVALRHRRRGDPDDDATLVVGDIEVDVARHRVTARGRDVDLTPKEFAFLTASARHPGRS